MANEVLDMSIYINGQRLANYSNCTRDYKANETVNETLGGTLYTDFLNIRRSWVISWDNLMRADYDIIYAFYLWRFQRYTFPILRVPAFGINAPVLLDISPQKLKYNAVIIKDFTLNVTEQFAFS